jgi:hypothetical protein
MRKAAPPVPQGARKGGSPCGSAFIPHGGSTALEPPDQQPRAPRMIAAKEQTVNDVAPTEIHHSLRKEKPTLTQATFVS